MHNTKNGSTPRTVAVLLFPSFSNHCLANAIEPLRASNTLARRVLYRWQFLGIDGRPLHSSSGLPVQPEATLSDHPGGDYLMIMPSYGFEASVSSTTIRALQAARRRFRFVAGLDTGSWLMAAAGLLDGRRATIHWDELSRFAEGFSEIDVVDDRFVIDGDCLSCGGVTTTLELMLELIGQHHGAALKLDVAALFMHGERDPKLDPFLRLPPDRVIQAAAAIMRRNVEAPLAIAQIARRLGIGQRALELQFSQGGARSPRAVYAAIRLGVARRLVEHTTLGMPEVAIRSGYQNASALTRAFRQEFGCPPSHLRRGRRRIRPTG